MRIIKQQKFYKNISEPLNRRFNISKNGLCIIEVSARGRSEKQIGPDETNDDDLRIEIDDIRFPKLDNPQKYLDSPAAFSGGKLHNRKKTVFFFVYLSKGEHTITFIPDREPKLEEFSIKFVGNNIFNVDLDINNQAEDGDRRPWITFVLVDLPLESLTAEIMTKYRLRDPDDVKVIIDNQIQAQSGSILHRFWVFAGSLLKKFFQKQETQIETFQPNLPKNLHYIEFYADKTPIFNKIEFNFGETDFRPRAKIIWKKVSLREEPNVNSSIIDSLANNDEVRVIEKATEGGWTKDRLSDIWHRVECEKQSGYIYSEALEIEKESVSAIQKLIIEKSREFGMDEELVLAVAEVETNFKPYRVSEDEAKGIFQLTSIAIKEIRGKSIGYNLLDPFDVYQNIEGGIRYFKWLGEQFSSYDREYLEKILVAWVCGLSCVDKNSLIEYDKLDNEAVGFVKTVLSRRRELKGHSGFSTFQALAFVATFVVLAFGTFFLLRYGNFSNQDYPQEGSSYNYELIRSKEGWTEGTLRSNLDNDRVIDEILLRESFSEMYFPNLRETLEYLNLDVYLKRNSVEKLVLENIPGYFKKAILKDMNDDGLLELAITMLDGQLLHTSMYKYDDGDFNIIPILPEHINDRFINSSGIEFIDLEGDKILEIVISHPNKEDSCEETVEIYKFNGIEFLRYIDSGVSETWCKNYENH